MSNICPICNYSSKSELGIKQHLSSSHKDENNPYKSKVYCNNCGNGFWMLDSYIDMGKGDFCSQKCQKDHGNVECICKNCNDKFKLHKNEYNRRKSNGKFCSRECESNYKSVDRTCQICDTKFTVKQSIVDSGRGNYCSKECYYESETKEGCDIRNTQEYKDWKKIVKSRDGECVKCGSKDNLHAHHIVPVSEDDSVVTDASNGETLCRNCHAKEHPELEELIRSANDRNL